MTAIFDGMAGLLNDTFGGPVTHTPQGGAAVDIQGVFREDPVTIFDEDDREVLVEVPTLRVLWDVAETISAGDSLTPGNGVSYLIGARHRASASPASDAFVLFELEDADP